VTGRLLLDQIYPPLPADMLRDKGHDVRAVAASAELAGADDATVLSAATADDCCLLTENVATLPCSLGTPPTPVCCSPTPGAG
jgi:predicted nuclease of predicted toxin-antitoxin system